MTASCPCCSGKWDIEGEHYRVILRCGDEHDIKCLYCQRVIPFVIEREYLEETVNPILAQGYVKEIERLEALIKEGN